MIKNKNLFKWKTAPHSDNAYFCPIFLENSVFKGNNNFLYGYGGKDFYSLDEAGKFLKDFSCLHMHSLKQVHGTDIITPSLKEVNRAIADNFGSKNGVKGCSEWDMPSDGWRVPCGEFLHSQNIFVLKTADCLPVFLLSSPQTVLDDLDAFKHDGYIDLIHAGWRGLRDGILVKALKRIEEEGLKLHAIFIGPAADPLLYEVGSEFKDYFSDEVLKPSNSSEKFFFDSYKEAIRQVRASGYTGEIYSSSISTMSDERFHSYRLEGDSAGRNLSFIAFP